jgi:hypothetical protein
MADFHHSEITRRKVSPPNRSDVRFQVAWARFSIAGVRRFQR